MTKVLDQAVGTLKRQVDALEATTRAAQAVPLSAAAAARTPQAAPGLGPHAEQLTELECKTTELAQVSGQTRERLQEAEKCLLDHDQGMRNLDARCTAFAGAATQAAPTAPQAAAFGAEYGATFTAGGAGQVFADNAEKHEIHSEAGARRQGPWKLYDEKYFLDGKNAYSPKDVATWLDDLRDYLAGRTPQLDQLFSW